MHPDIIVAIICCLFLIAIPVIAIIYDENKRFQIFITILSFIGVFIVMWQAFKIYG